MDTLNHELPEYIDGAINLDVTEGVDRFDDVFMEARPEKILEVAPPKESLPLPHRKWL